MLKGRVKLGAGKKLETNTSIESVNSTKIDEQKKSVSRTKSKVKEQEEFSLENLAKSRSRVIKKQVYEFGETPSIHSKKFEKINPEQPFIFDENDWLTVGDGDGYQSYFRRKYYEKTSVKYGQLKLLTTEIQFFNKYWNPEIVASPLCVYVGSAPGIHLIPLLKMYPQITFHLYDPRDVFDKQLYDKEFSSRVSIFVKFFTSDDAVKYSGRNDVYFISDIRSSDYNRDNSETEESKKINEALVKEDLTRQAEWVEIIQPVKAHLKFRLPFQEPYDWVEKETLYFDGDVYKQAWAPQTSTETRLVPDLKAVKRKWNNKMYEDMLFYHNNVVRQHANFINVLNQNNESYLEELGLTQDYDSTVFIQTLKEYVSRFTYETPIDEEKTVLNLARSILEDLGKPSFIVDSRKGVKISEIEVDDE
jgi:hypothetical protein